MFTAYQSRILALLSENPQREYYLHELGRLLGKKPGVFQRGLNSLQAQGWIVSRKQGNLRLLKINNCHPLYKEIASVVRKTVGVEAQLKKVVDDIKGIKFALIFGSYARGGMRPDSDVDLLVIADDPAAEDKLVEKLAIIERAFSREVNYKIYEDCDFRRRRKLKDPFLTEVLGRKHIVLKGPAA
jgi:predicted nucleotidyltransferase